jgi:hypothetical protein
MVSVLYAALSHMQCNLEKATSRTSSSRMTMRYWCCGTRKVSPTSLSLLKPSRKNNSYSRRSYKIAEHSVSKLRPWQQQSFQDPFLATQSQSKCCRCYYHRRRRESEAPFDPPIPRRWLICTGQDGNQEAKQQKLQ